jgi:hypothetical protein
MKVKESEHQPEVIRAMITAGPSVAVATVAALLVYSFGRVMRSPLKTFYFAEFFWVPFLDLSQKSGERKKFSPTPTICRRMPGPKQHHLF